MGIVVTVMNMKGGVGKTVVASHLASMLPFRSKPRQILAIDYDPQFNLSQAYVPAKTYFALERAHKTVRAVLQDKESSVDPFVLQPPGTPNPPTVAHLAHTVRRYSKGGSLDVVVSTMDLMHIAIGQPDQRIAAFEERFRRFITDARKAYDVVVVDCHPSGSILTKTSLMNSDHVIIPVVDSPYAVRGVALMTKFIDALDDGAGQPMKHILFNNVRQPDAKVFREIREEYGDECLNSHLKHFKAFADLEEGKGFVWTSTKPYSTKAFWNLAGVTEEIVDRLAL